ncbi:TY-Chap domain-containing protein [Rhodococcus sp. NPDC078407]|uniref:TY-Chap domain-containing protein n=1 Tax=Rhodococcus sp. NPDC078407 TaxID=3364509 RepID=UPI0037C89663
MNALQNGHFDSTTALAWATFTSNLHACLRSLPSQDYITVTAAQASPGERGLRPYIDVASTDTGVLVSVAAVPSLLYPHAPDTAVMDVRLAEFGWLNLGKPVADGSIIDLTRTDVRTDAALVAELITSAFREIWNVPHPSFLSAWGVAADGLSSGPVDLQRGLLPQSTATEDSSETPPNVPAELRSLQALCQLVGRRVDAHTVTSVCIDSDLDDLKARAVTLHRSAAGRARRSVGSGRDDSAAVWSNLARTWLSVVRSIDAALHATRHACS